LPADSADYLHRLSFSESAACGNLRSFTTLTTMPKQKRTLRRGLTLLGRANAKPPDSPSAEVLETFENRFPQRDYWVRFDCPDFTSLCPITSQPDFAKIRIDYVPGRRCIETKSLKFYLASYRGTRGFNEEIVNRILDDLVEACAPRKLIVHGEFAPRGGITLTVDATHPAEK
jgi:7-cyano-7-deazaguanine reductase